jgi:hypothetical protein
MKNSIYRTGRILSRACGAKQNSNSESRFVVFEMSCGEVEPSKFSKRLEIPLRPRKVRHASPQGTEQKISFHMSCRQAVIYQLGDIFTLRVEKEMPV